MNKSDQKEVELIKELYRKMVIIDEANHPEGYVMPVSLFNQIMKDVTRRNRIMKKHIAEEIVKKDYFLIDRMLVVALLSAVFIVGFMGALVYLGYSAHEDKYKPLYESTFPREVNWTCESSFWINSYYQSEVINNETELVSFQEYLKSISGGVERRDCKIIEQKIMGVKK